MAGAGSITDVGTKTVGAVITVGVVGVGVGVGIPRSKAVA